MRTEVSPEHTCHSISSDGPASCLFLQRLLFVTAAAFFVRLSEALFASNALGPEQKTESEKCAFAVSMLPIHPLSGLRLKIDLRRAEE